MKKVLLYLSLLTTIYLILTFLSVIFHPIHKWNQYIGEFRLGLVLTLFVFGYLAYLFTKPVRR
ncbi:hypothetical protein [Flavobacterium algicola]|uniref:hypothetical protein n=1 Tax=Flavobacterium algicola TaxID=556529 RepID=UPI001EFEAD71|nr:hypothetical protein [Flavobacterium algicola]MCG9791842.1 hypothetical protein [Flavobacterium algicola]